MSEKAVLMTGSNLQDRKSNLDRARELVALRCGKVVSVSGVYESEPWGEVEGDNGEAARPFLNQALVVETALEPEQLLDTVKAIEAEMGRTPHTDRITGNGTRRYFSRIIDIDIIFYGERIVETPRLTIPHPMAAEREFVLRPVAEIAPAAADPVTGLSVAEMLGRVKGLKTSKYYE